MAGVRCRPDFHHAECADGQNDGHQPPIVIAYADAVVVHGLRLGGGVGCGVAETGCGFVGTGSGFVGTPSSASGSALLARAACAANDGGIPGGTACVVSCCGGILPCFLS